MNADELREIEERLSVWAVHCRDFCRTREGCWPSWSKKEFKKRHCDHASYVFAVQDVPRLLAHIKELDERIEGLAAEKEALVTYGMPTCSRCPVRVSGDPFKENDCSAQWASKDKYEEVCKSERLKWVERKAKEMK